MGYDMDDILASFAINISRILNPFNYGTTGCNTLFPQMSSKDASITVH